MSNEPFQIATTALFDQFAQTRPIHANSLILSIFGDSVCPHGDAIWLGSIIKLVEPLGINQRLVRTSVFRLTEKGILQSKQVGRRSFYSLTDKGYRQFSTAATRIYLDQHIEWDGQWRLVLTGLGSLTQDQRDLLRRELHWLGFSRLIPGVYAHPTADVDVVNKVITELQLDQRVAIITGNTHDLQGGMLSNELICQSFKVESIEQEYEEFIATFEPILEATIKSTILNAKACFLLRTLLIHKFRRILLREPELPAELVPQDAISNKARKITEMLYKLITSEADQHFLMLAENEGGCFHRASDDYYSRFGGVHSRN